MNSVQAVKKSPKINVELDGDMPSHYALSAILLQNLNMLERCEPGIIEDNDIEFLHTFRVVGRRSRSLINQLKRIYSVSRITRFKKAFAWLSDFTSLHRDLDVFLADFSRYENRIAHNGINDLEPLRFYLESQRLQEHHFLLNALSSKRYASFKQSWREYLLQTEIQAPRTPNSQVPINRVVNKAIWRNYRKIIKQGKQMVSGYEYDAIHTLRKDAKKLRYLLESFKSIYAIDEINRTIKVLKRLQNNLGDIVDMHTQKFMLEQWKQDLLEENSSTAETQLAINQLVLLCNEGKRVANRKFIKCFKQFSVKSNQKLFQHVFH
ncbi:MAG: CHAD domain-containing protein [Proteobacteria bacterium]|nr:CHAD domain-containing protein [Pseudomonadota bacterium]